MSQVAHRTLERYTSRYRHLACKWIGDLPDRDAPENMVIIYLEGGRKEVHYRQPSEIELAFFLERELAHKHAFCALIGGSGSELKSNNFRKYSSFECDRYALLYFFRREISNCPKMDLLKRAEIELAISILGEIGVQLKKLGKNKTIHQDAKSDRPGGITEPEWKRLSAVLISTHVNLKEQQRKTNAMHAAAFFSAGLATGAQLREWARATWANEERTSVRFFAPTRRVVESKIFESKFWTAEAQPKARYRDVKFDPTYFEHIQRHFHHLDQVFEGCGTVEGRDIAFEAYVKGCGKAMLAARKKIKEWDGDPTKAYTLSVARSQFPALQSLTDSIRQNEDLGMTSATISAVSQYGRSQDALRGHAVVTHPTNASA